MKCPICKSSELIVSNRHGIEINYCPNCRGMWLDRGEADKVIRAAGEEEATRTSAKGASDSG